MGFRSASVLTPLLPTPATRPDMNMHGTPAFVFPGQGSQSVGMLGPVAALHPVVADTFEEASAVLGFDLWTLVQRGPEQELNRTVNTQPALLAAGVALWRVWMDHGGARPGLVAGHSLGEYTALVCAGSLRFTQAIRLVADRGRFMQEAVPDGVGAMAAVLGLDDEQVEAACAEAAGTGDGVVAPANYNCPGQIVISGHRIAVERALQLARAAGAKRAVFLPVSVPSHCALMEPAARRLAQRLETVNLADASIAVVQNVDGAARTAGDEIREALIRQLQMPVRWVDCVHTLRRHGARHFIECGPGHILGGLIRRVDRSVEVSALCDPDGLRETLEKVAHDQTA